MASLFSPLTIRGVTLKNRIAVSPMVQYSSTDGFANDWHLVHLGSRAVGGAGLVICEATAIVPEGRITPGDLGIWKDEHIPFLNRITDFIHSQGSIAGIQLAHAGRKASFPIPWKGLKALKEDEGGWKPVGPSSIPFSEGDPVPKELNREEIKKVVYDFRKAAERALNAGFRVAEIHAAHGYLINEFLSPFSNRRTDEYGGTFENRIRLLTEVVEDVRKVWPSDLPLFVRISASEWKEGGWLIGDSVILSGILKTKGVDLIDCSSGGNIPGVKITIKPLYQVEFAETIKNETGILTGAVGLITTAQEAEFIIAENKADLVLLAREFLRDPYFPIHAARELNADITWPIQYERGKKK
jgi:2,4-dienoyl-CoA reductase-like NADH-dependent reductase (Old Yellow Enzyme family)